MEIVPESFEVSVGFIRLTMNQPNSNPDHELEPESSAQFSKRVAKFWIALFALGVTGFMLFSYVVQFEFKTYSMPYGTTLRLKIFWSVCAICPADPPWRLQAKFERNDRTSEWLDLKSWDYHTTIQFFTSPENHDSLVLIHFDGVNYSDDYAYDEGAIEWVDAQTLKGKYLDSVPDNLYMAHEFLASF
jgi:hypothetical protein